MHNLQELVIELTDRCPLLCGHCSSNSGPSCENSLDLQTVQRILGEAAGLNTAQISFGGGEPTISPVFPEALQETVRLGFAAEVFTSGIFLNKMQHPIAFTSEYAKLLARTNMLTLTFSFHGSCAEIHDSVTGINGSFELTVDSLRKCFDQGLRCAANFVPTKLNAAEFAATVSMLKSLGISKLSILRFVPQGRGLSNRNRLELNRSEEDCFVRNLMDIRRETDMEIRTGSPFNGIIPGNNVPCRAGFQKLVVQPDGNVIPCEVFKHHGRRGWDASIYSATLAAILDLPQFTKVQRTLSGELCTACPVHSELRANRPN